MPNTHGLTKGCRITLIIEGNPLDGAQAKFIYQSDRTGDCMVELMEDRNGIWKKGDRLTVKAYEMT